MWKALKRKPGKSMENIRRHPKHYPGQSDWPFNALNNAGKVIKGSFVGAFNLTPLLIKQKERPLCFPSKKVIFQDLTPNIFAAKK